MALWRWLKRTTRGVGAVFDKLITPLTIFAVLGLVIALVYQVQSAAGTVADLVGVFSLFFAAVVMLISIESTRISLLAVRASHLANEADLLRLTHSIEPHIGFSYDTHEELFLLDNLCHDNVLVMSCYWDVDGRAQPAMSETDRWWVLPGGSHRSLKPPDKWPTGLYVALRHSDAGTDIFALEAQIPSSMALAKAVLPSGLIPLTLQRRSVSSDS